MATIRQLTRLLREPTGAHQEFAQQLRKARLQAGLSQYELAWELLVSHKAVHMWERGLRIPRSKNLKALCHILDVQLAPPEPPVTSDKTAAESGETAADKVRV
jgi:ribosome-binding protein aMBF1 (putative translation factor)